MASTPCKTLSNYFRNVCNGVPAELPHRYSLDYKTLPGTKLIVHEDSRIILWPEPLRFGEVRGDASLFYFYTDAERFYAVHGSKDIFACLHEFGDLAGSTGIWASRKAPDEFISKEAIARNMCKSHSENSSKSLKNNSVSQGGSDFCIAFMIPSSMAKDISLPAPSVSNIITPASKSALPSLLESSHGQSGGSQDLWQCTLNTLTVLDGRDSMLSNLANKDVRVRHSTLKAIQNGLRCKCTSTKDLAQILCVCFEDKSEEIRLLAADIFSKLIPAGDNSAMQVIRQRIDHESVCVRRIALQVLGDFASRGHRETIESCLQSMDDGDEDVKLTAADAIGKLAEHGDAKVIAAVASLISNAQERLLPVLVQVAERVCSKGDDAIMAALSRRLLDGSAKIRQITVAAFSILAVPGNLRVVTAVAKVLDDSEIFVRQTAIRTLADLAIVGQRSSEATVTEVVARHLKSPCLNTRMAAVRAVLEIAAKTAKGKQCDEVAVEALVKSLGDEEDCVRWAAASGLTDIAGDGRLAKQLLEQCISQRGSAVVKEAALRCLSKIASRGDADALKVAEAALQDSEWIVRCAAIWAIRQLAEKGDERMLNALAERSSDPDPEVVASCLKVMLRLGSADDERIIGSVRRSLACSDARICVAVIQTIADAAALGRNAVIQQDISACLTHQDQQVKIHALQALSSLKRKGDQSALASIRPLVEDEFAGVRLAAVKALLVLVEESDRETIASIGSTIDDAHWSVRYAAVEGLGKIISPEEDSICAQIKKRYGDSDNMVKTAALDAIPLISKRCNSELEVTI